MLALFERSGASPPGHRGPSAAVSACLRRLHARGLGDGQIAERLTDLDPADPWTRRRVEYHRRKLKLPGNPPSRQPGHVSLPDLRTFSRRVYAAKRGWPPFLDRPGGAPFPEMSSREVDCLDLLLDRGAQPLRAVALALGPLSPRFFGRLLRCGLVVRDDDAYSLAPGVARFRPSERPTSIDLFLRRLSAPEDLAEAA